MTSKRLPDNRYAMDIIENHLNLEKEKNFNHQIFQKKKFETLSKLVNDLFKHKNSIECYNTISNLIFVSLTAFDGSPPDIFSEDPKDKEKEIHDDYFNTLKEEFQEEVQTFNRCLTIEKEFRDTLSRFMDQYDIIKNVELRLTPKKKKNGFPN